jgi:hypothetical protein
MRVDSVAIVILACCVLHNFCEIHYQRVSLSTDVEHHRNQYVGLCTGALRLLDDFHACKVAGEMMRAMLFYFMVQKKPNIVMSLILFWPQYYTLASIIWNKNFIMLSYKTIVKYLIVINGSYNLF